MKKSLIIVSLLISVWLLFLGITWTVNFLDWRSEYAEAEPLVQTVWPLGKAIKEFEEKNGRRPISLDEIEENTSDIEDLTHTFHTVGPIILEIKVNERFGFTIDSEYLPSWTTKE